MREACDQIHADVAKAGGREEVRGSKDILAAVHPARGLKFAVVEGLHAQADAVEAGREPCGRFYGRNRFGIGLERDFEKVGAIALPQRIENLRQSGRLEKARRAAAEIDRVDDIRPADETDSAISRQTASA